VSILFESSTAPRIETRNLCVASSLEVLVVHVCGSRDSYHFQGISVVEGGASLFAISLVRLS
jgi:hypothetical protein